MLPRMAFLTALLCLCSLPAPASELEMIANGDFELELSLGWEERIAGDALIIERAPDLDPDPDYEVSLHTFDGHGEAELRQTCFLPGLDAILSMDLRSSAVDGNGAWAAAGLMIRYMDENAAVIGRTFIGSLSPFCPWESADDFDIVRSSGDWSHKSFMIGDLLAGLPAVDPSRVLKLEVALLVSAANC